MSEIDLELTCTSCSHEFTIVCDIDPGEDNYGADADGNRGINILPSAVAPDIVYCPGCGADLSVTASEKAADYEIEPDYEGPDTLDEDDR